MGLALCALAAIAIGFPRTYILPMAEGRFAAPLIVHFHGLFALCWPLLFLAQAWLARAGRMRTHMALGNVAIPLAVAIWGSGILTAAWAARRDLPSQGIAADTGFFGTVSGLSLFLGFVVAGYLRRKTPAAHKRWLALALIALLWPAVFRWRHLLPAVDRPDILYGMLIANLPILVAMVRDRLRYGEVHPVWWTGGLLWFVEQGLEVALFDRNLTAPLGHAILAFLP